VTTLETRPYGKTGENVSIIGLGGLALNQESLSDGVATVRRALELGVTYFDTAPAYGDGASQAIMGEALEGRSEQYMLATKLGHFADPTHFRSPAALQAQLRDNLRLLRRDSVDTLQVHEADWQSWWSDDASRRVISPDLQYDFHTAPILDVLQEAKDRGQCRFVGITGNTAEETARVLRYVEVDAFLVAFQYNLIWRDAHTKAFPIAREKEVAIILGGVFQNGQLAKVYPELLASPPQWMTPQLRECFERLYALQSDCGLPLIELAIRYVLSDPTPATILVGAATPAELEESVAAAHAGPLPDDLHQAVEEVGLP